MSCFNTDEFSFRDIKLKLITGKGRTLGESGEGFARLQGFSYTVSIPKTPVFGTGGKQVSTQKGEVAISGSVKITQHNLQFAEEELSATGYGGSILDSGCFRIEATLQKKSGTTVGKRTVVVTLYKVEFNEYTTGTEIGTEFETVELPFTAAGLKKVQKGAYQDTEREQVLGTVS